MQRLTVIENPFDRSSWSTIMTDDVVAALQQRYARFPETGRLYCGQVTKQNDVTPNCEADIDALKYMDEVTAVIYPQGVETLIYVAIALIAVVALTLATKKVPTAVSRNFQTQSPNNALSGRSNTARVNGRIPDIFGTVRSTPDLIAVPYSVFIDHIEFEYTYMCIGRGQYNITASTVRDGTTAVSEIEGESVEIYGPNTSPNNTPTPQLTVGTPIDRLVISAARSKSVNGQTLLAPNDNSSGVNYSGKIGFAFPGYTGNAEMANDTGDGGDFTHDFTVGENVRLNTSTYVNAPINFGSPDIYLNGDYSMIFHADGSIEIVGVIVGDTNTQAGSLEITGANFNVGSTPYDFSGKYVCAGYSGNNLILYAPADSNVNWTLIASVFGGATPSKVCHISNPQVANFNLSGLYQIFAISTTRIAYTPAAVRTNNNWAWLRVNLHLGDRERYTSVTLGENAGTEAGWVGPFMLDVPTMDQIICNFVALQGMYKDDGSTQTAAHVDLQIGVTPVDAGGTATGAEGYFSITVEGSGVTTSSRAATLFGNLAPIGRYKVRARRLTPLDLDFVGTVVDEVKWRDLYASSPVGVGVHFGDVTTVHARTQATASALAVQDRQMNMIVQRRLPVFHGGDVFGPTYLGTNSAADILSFIALDPKIGNRPKAEVNFDQIYATVSDIITYFGQTIAGEFSYTFDSDNLSFEETAALIADAIFCTANRRGSVIELKFEKETEDSVLLFNHRNKVPKSETRTTTFGNDANNDGIEYSYVSPIDDAVLTFYIPTDKSAINPLKIESVGIRSEIQAHLQAYRRYNKLLYKTRTTQFDATQEAEIVSITSRILVADNTRPDTQDGQIDFQDGFVLKLSQPAVMNPLNDYVICLQMPDGTVDILDCIPGESPYFVVLTEPPSGDIISDDSHSIKTLYQIVKVDDLDNRSFLLMTKEPQSNFITTLTAINYDARYYANDQDYNV